MEGGAHPQTGSAEEATIKGGEEAQMNGATAMIDTGRLSNLKFPDNAAVAVAIRLNGVIVWNHVHECSQAPIGQERGRLRFPIYSITKTLTALCILRLQQAGILHSDDSMRRRLPDLPLPESITLAHLLRHTSGLPDYGPLPEYHKAVRDNPSSPWTPKQFLDVATQRGLLFEPGMSWSYSNIGYMLLRLVIEAASGMTLRDAVAQFVTSPIDLGDTFIAEHIKDWSSCVPGYGREVDADKIVVDVRDRYHPVWCAPGVAVSTIEDTTRLFDALFGSGLLSKESLRSMQDLIRVPGDHPPAITPSYGMGIMADPDAPFGPWFGHGGGGPGYALWASIIPKSKVGRLAVAVFCNTTEAKPEQIAYETVSRLITADL
jgi:D-alanyl-D-alanine carboxypeptidase